MTYMFIILLFSWLTAQKRPPTWLTTSWLTTNIQKIAKNAQKSPKFGPFFYFFVVNRPPKSAYFSKNFRG